MTTRESVLRLVREGHTYREAAGKLGISPGLAYMIATGVPTDSSDGLSPEDLARDGLLSEAQSLSNPGADQPDRSTHVRAFLAARAARDQQMQEAAGRRQPSS